MTKAKKKVAAAVKVTVKEQAKVGVAKKVLKKVSFGAGLLYRNVRKAGKVVQPAAWKNAGDAVKARFDGMKGSLGQKMTSLTAKKSVVTAPAPKVEKTPVKKAAPRKRVRKAVKPVETPVEPSVQVENNS
ncbi:MAG: hypothetical protein HQL17_02765 [Candidatus Omnitrophica bacterium]|nr:hypothetical protein [Candidatus Omnitrophota bacterium]